MSPLSRRVVVGVAVISAALGSAGVLVAPVRIRLVGSDPSYYLSYALDYGDVAARYGQTYHGNRIAYLFVDRAAFALFGPEVGYLVARSLALAVAVAVVVALAAPRVGHLAAVGLGAAVAMTPWLPRQLLWTHYDGFAAVHLLVASWLLLGDPGRRWRLFAAGVALSLVVNTNLAFAVLVATGVVAWVVAVPLDRSERIAGLVRIGAGFLCSLLVLSVTVRVVVGSGPWFSEWIAIQTALFLAGDATWFTPLRAAVARNPMLAVLPVLGAGALAAARRPLPSSQRPDAALFGGLWLTGAFTFVLALHLIASTAWLGASFYVVVFLPPVVVAMTGIAERLRIVGPVAPPSSVLAGGSILLVWMLVLAFLWRSARLQPWALGASVTALATMLAAVATGARAPTVLRRTGMLMMPVVLLATWAAPAQVPGTDGFPDLAAREDKEWTLFNAIRGVKGVVAANVPTDRQLVLWHRVGGREGAWLREINMAYYGGGTGRLHRDKGDDPYGMPELRAGQVTSLRERAPISVVLLGLDRSELTAGLVALATAVPDGDVVAQTVLPGATFDLHVAVVEID